MVRAGCIQNVQYAIPKAHIVTLVVAAVIVQACARFSLSILLSS